MFNLLLYVVRIGTQLRDFLVKVGEFRSFATIFVRMDNTCIIKKNGNKFQSE